MGPFEASILISIAVAVVVAFALYVRHLSNAAYQQTVRLAIEKGQQLTPEFLERLGETLGRKSRNRDLRYGVIAVALGLGIGLFGVIIGGSFGDARELLAIGSLPILIGIALIGLWKFAPPE